MPLLDPPVDPHLFRAYGALFFRSRHPAVRRLQRRHQPSVHGHRAWGAGFLLMDYLAAEPLARRARVMEIGAGWAPAGIFCALRFGARVTAVDRDPEVFPYAGIGAELNGVRIATLERSFAALARRDLAGFDAVIGSDICFWDNLARPLEELVRRAVAAGVRRVVITDPGRSPFLRLARRLDDLQPRLVDWYALEPSRYVGKVLDVRVGPGVGRRTGRAS